MVMSRRQWNLTTGLLQLLLCRAARRARQAAGRRYALPPPPVSFIVKEANQ